MKIIFCLTITIFNLFFSFGQKTQENKNVLKINVIPVFNSIYDIQYERVLTKNSAIQIGLSFGNTKDDDIKKVQELHLETFRRTLNNPKNGFITEKIFSMNVDYKFYLDRNLNAPNGIYLSPSIQYISSKNSFGALEMDSSGNVDGSFNYYKREYTQEFSLTNIRVLVGYQLIIAKRIIFNPYFGPGFAFGDAKGYNNKQDESAKGILLNYGLAIGVGF